MGTFKSNKYLIPLLFIALAGIGCSNKIQPVKSGKAQLGYKTQAHLELRAVPPAQNPIYVVVYKFRDQTGQYKPGTGTTGWSTAVTQGATSMLIKALQDAGDGKWFNVLERESLPNLLNERKIIRQTRQKYEVDEKGRYQELPPLNFAPIMLEGGIIAYESNVLTGGLGARYLGIGANTKYQRDVVTIYLRAVSVKNGQVLKSVTTNKTIFSIGMDAGIHKFVGFRELLEVEAGFTTNEPPQMAVLEAIERATYSLIMEGAIEGLWNFQDANMQAKWIKKYLKEKSTVVTAEFDDKGNLVAVHDPSQKGHLKSKSYFAKKRNEPRRR